ncbi:MAG TPA: hypothetical protein P5081_07845 [Phycisphaerae bacterium]|nr:hypothetical protein [Phycisphaerae bacterium]HRW52784.1 hypothetical protein [Phycisphaerae bacterium]
MSIRLDILADVRIAAPCPAEWDDMRGDDRVRHCDQCDKSVYNIADMTRMEAVALLTHDGATPCVRIHRRTDGTVLTSDCPVGQRLRRRARKWVAAVAGLFGVTLGASGGCIIMGAVCEDPNGSSSDARNAEVRAGTSEGDRPAAQQAPVAGRMIDRSTRPD